MASATAMTRGPPRAPPMDSDRYYLQQHYPTPPPPQQQQQQSSLPFFPMQQQQSHFSQQTQPQQPSYDFFNAYASDQNQALAAAFDDAAAAVTFDPLPLLPQSSIDNLCAWSGYPDLVQQSQTQQHIYQPPAAIVSPPPPPSWPTSASSAPPASFNLQQQPLSTTNELVALHDPFSAEDWQCFDASTAFLVSPDLDDSLLFDGEDFSDISERYGSLSSVDALAVQSHFSDVPPFVLDQRTNRRIEEIGDVVDIAPKQVDSRKRPHSLTEAAAASSSSSPLPVARKQKTRGKFEPSRRKEVKDVRDLGACMRCRIYKLRCDKKNPCSTCVAVKGKSRIFHLDCHRESLETISVARGGNARMGQQDVSHLSYNWESSSIQVRRISVNWTLPGASLPVLSSLDLTVRKYRPSSDGSETKITWSVGDEAIHLPLPPYAIASASDLEDPLATFLAGLQPQLESHYLHRNISDPVHAATFHEAQRYRTKHDSKPLELAFKTLSGSLFSQGWGSLCGNDTLDISPYRPPSTVPTPSQVKYSKYYALSTRQIIPVPEAIDHGIDVAVLSYLRKLHSPLVHALKARIFPSSSSSSTTTTITSPTLSHPSQKKPKKESPWYEVFLTLFILLSNLEFITAGASEYLASQRHTATEQAAERVIHRMQADWAHSADNMLQHFECVVRGGAPFRATSQQLSDRDGIWDPHALEYVREVGQILEGGDGFEGFERRCEEQGKGRWVDSLFRIACQAQQTKKASGAKKGKKKTEKG